MKFWKKFILGILIVLVLIGAGFVAWGYTPLGPMPEAQAALQSDAQVKVEQGRWLVFNPVGITPQTGFIYYPGGRVDYRSYAPYAHAMAERGFLVVIVPMPLNLAVFGSGSASAVQAAYPEVQSWAVGGHSLGGAMAAHFAFQHPQGVSGLILFAAYPASSDSLANTNIKVMSIYGTNDGLATQGKIDASRQLLPASTQWLAIQGGNHAQFGWYGVQPGDNPASISREQQQVEAVDATVAFLAKLGR